MNIKVYHFPILILLITPCLGQSQKESPFPSDVRCVLFIGNSITYAGEYVTNIEAYFVTHYPLLQVEFINVGLPSETVSGLSEPGHADGKFPRPDLHERLDRVLQQTRPDWVFACYGMNDGIYMPLDNERFQKFKEGINWLHDTVLKSGVKRIIHLTPPLFDERRGGHHGYARVLDIYSDWLLKQRAGKHWDVADIHGLMKKNLKKNIKKDPSFALAPDGIHPSQTGHWLMAQAILLYLGEDDMKHADNITEALGSAPNADSILRLIGERQHIMKDAWLTSIGHQRPGMCIGMPLDDAKVKANEIALRIAGLQK
ncbi:MAG: G-D-S-L family lipolytic protein [Marivirga sp.]|nr:G-D-S-L family lipolytic protein [Marivirga sp.]